MRRWTGALLAVLALVTAACSPLGALNAFSPGDGGSVRLAEGAAYGADVRQKLDIYAPTRAAPGTPVVVFFYGGSWSSGRRQDYAFAARAIASRGLVVVVPDYRLVPQVRFPAFVQDAASAVRWTQLNVSRYGGDPARMAVMGHSAGAYIAAMVALDGKWLREAGAPPGTVKAWVGLSGPYDFYPFDVKASQDAFGPYPDPHATQPIAFARADAPPALLVHGLADTTVKPRNSEALAAALRARGAVAELKLYPGLSHTDTLVALSRLFRGKAPVLADSVGFLGAKLGAGAVAPRAESRR